jgi:tripartite-type tricarboxylate transporter receptor subunit TctC
VKSLIAIACILAGLIGGHAQADTYPSKPIKLINPWQIGGGVDALARLLGSKMQEKWGQPVIVDSKAGAGGNIGTDFVAKSAPDGYTLLINNGTLTTNPSFFSKMPFDVERDLAPISMIAMQEFYLVVANNMPVKNMRELVAYAKANPGKVFYSTPGPGTPQHLAGELLKSMAGIDIVHIPYKGQAPAITDVMAGQVQMTWVTLNVALPLIHAGKVRGIAIGAKERLPAYKDLPVIAETVPGYEIYTWVGLFAPAGTPQPIIQQLTGEVHRFTQLPDVKEKLVPLGYEIKTSTPAELKSIMSGELVKWAKVVKNAGIKPD